MAGPLDGDDVTSLGRVVSAEVVGTAELATELATEPLVPDEVEMLAPRSLRLDVEVWGAESVLFDEQLIVRTLRTTAIAATTFPRLEGVDPSRTFIVSRQITEEAERELGDRLPPDPLLRMDLVQL